MITVRIQDNPGSRRVLNSLMKQQLAFGAGFVKNAKELKREYNPKTGGTRKNRRGITVEDVARFQEKGIPGVPHRSIVNYCYSNAAFRKHIVGIIQRGFKKAIKQGDEKIAIKAIEKSADYLRKKMKNRFRNNNFPPLSKKTRPKSKTRTPMLFTGQLRRSLGVVQMRNGKTYGKFTGKVKLRQTDKMFWPEGHSEALEKFRRG